MSTDCRAHSSLPKALKPSSHPCGVRTDSDQVNHNEYELDRRMTAALTSPVAGSGAAVFSRVDRTGTSWSRKNEVLCVFHPFRIDVFRAGEQPLAWSKSLLRPAFHGTRGNDRSLSIPRALARVAEHRTKRREALLCGDPVGPRATSKMLALSAFVDGIAPQHAALLGQFDRDAWPVFTFLVRAEAHGAVELAASNPGLAFALSHYHLLGPPVCQPARSIRRLLRHKRARIAEVLGYPRASVNVLQKCAVNTLTAVDLQTLRAALHAPDLALRIRHLPRVNGAVLALISSPLALAMCSQTLLLDVAVRRAAKPSVRSILSSCDALGIKPPMIRDLKHLSEVSNELRFEVHRLRLRDDLDVHPPPIPASEGIEPLATAAELFEEGVAQSNCLRDRGLARANGASRYTYRVLAPTRATLSIVRPRSGRGWRIDTLLGRFNRPVPQVTREHVQRWLSAAADPPSPQPTVADARQMALDLVPPGEVPF